MESLLEAGRQGLRAFVESYESSETVIMRDGRTYRLKDEACEKNFLTLFGELGIKRRCYHCAKGGKGIVPLDESWMMNGRYATPEIVENVLWLSASLPPSEKNRTRKE